MGVSIRVSVPLTAWIVDGRVVSPDTIECLHELLNSNLRGNLQLVVNIVTQYSEQLTPEEIIKLFDSHKSWDGLYYYLGAIVNTSESPLVHFKYIQAASELKQYREVERVCRDSTVYDANEVKQYLKEAKLPDPRPLIHVCDRCVVGFEPLRRSMLVFM